MSWKSSLVLAASLSALLSLAACGGSSSQSTAVHSDAVQLTVQMSGDGAGTVSSNPPGINCGSSCSGSFGLNSQVSLTATPNSGSSFVGWGGACTGNNTCTLALNSSASVIATFSRSPVLTVSLSGTGTGSVSSNPAGISCGTTCSTSFTNGTQVTLTATPAQGSTFAGWGGACSGVGSCVTTLSTNASVSATFNAGPPSLTVVLGGKSTGRVTSSPSGIDCPGTCTASFTSGTQVTLTETPDTSNPFIIFGGWGDACSGNGKGNTCALTITASQNVGATFNFAINHIIFLAQENRGFDHYFGALRQYWKDNGIPDQDFDGLPQFNPTQGQPPTNPGCDPTLPPPNDCRFDPNTLIPSYKLITQCVENPSPSWNESHVDWDYFDPTGQNAATLNGFVWTAAHDGRALNYFDTIGKRAIGYYDGSDLNYYYFMATKFATSDRWFSPVMTRTQPNREYLIAATSQGLAYPRGFNQQHQQLLTATTIFEELQNAGISWKIYVNPIGSNCSGPPYDAKCLLGTSYVQNFQWGQTIPSQYPNNLGTIGIQDSDFDNDVKNSTLPQVAMIEPASDAGLDEHGSDYDAHPIAIQLGAKYVSGLINNVMTSQSWSDSVFILTYDEFGGFYDHVSPQGPIFSPDGIPPIDIPANDLCYGTPNIGTCDFTYTGYRVPLIVVSPYTKKNYVSHTVADFTAILKLIEKRFALQPLTNRDANQMDMTEFFDFANAPWMNPPTPPKQNMSDPCYLNQLP